MAALYEERTQWAPFILFEYDHQPGTYCLMLSDAQMGPVEAVFANNGRDIGGYGFSDLALGVMRADKPELEARLGMDPEAGTFCAYGKDLEALQDLATRLHGLFHDHARLGPAVKAAPYEYD